MELFEKRLALLNTFASMQVEMKSERIFENMVALSALLMKEVTEEKPEEKDDVLSWFKDPESYICMPEFGEWKAGEIVNILRIENEQRIEAEKHEKRAQMIRRIQAGEYDDE